MQQIVKARVIGIRDHGLASVGALRIVTVLPRRVATFVDRIFKDAKPGELPIQQPAIIELHINGETAKASGLKIPQALPISAGKVIESMPATQACAAFISTCSAHLFRLWPFCALAFTAAACTFGSTRSIRRPLAGFSAA